MRSFRQILEGKYLGKFSHKFYGEIDTLIDPPFIKDGKEYLSIWADINGSIPYDVTDDSDYDRERGYGEYVDIDPHYEDANIEAFDVVISTASKEDVELEQPFPEQIQKIVDKEIRFMMERSMEDVIISQDDRED